MSNTRMILAVALMAVSMPAFASSGGSQNEYPRLSVSYADINLATQTGAEVMLRRIFQAARQVCGDRAGIRDIAERREIRFCIRVASANAVNDIKSPMLSALFEGRSARDYDYALGTSR
jgi:UrcA family protein